MFIEGNQQAGMEAFMSGQIKVEGDMTKLDGHAGGRPAHRGAAGLPGQDPRSATVSASSVAAQARRPSSSRQAAIAPLGAPSRPWATTHDSMGGAGHVVDCLAQLAGGQASTSSWTSSARNPPAGGSVEYRPRACLVT